MPAIPKVEARNEIIDDADNDDAVEGYEQLRRRALCGDADGWRLGLGVLQHRGVAGWLRVRSASTPVRSAPARPMPCVARGVDAELVELLTSMALTVAAAGVSGHE